MNGLPPRSRSAWLDTSELETSGGYHRPPLTGDCCRPIEKYITSTTCFPSSLGCNSARKKNKRATQAASETATSALRVCGSCRDPRSLPALESLCRDCDGERRPRITPARTHTPVSSAAALLCSWVKIHTSPSGAAGHMWHFQVYYEHVTQPHLKTHRQRQDRSPKRNAVRGTHFQTGFRDFFKRH